VYTCKKHEDFVVNMIFRFRLSIRFCNNSILIEKSFLFNLYISAAGEGSTTSVCGFSVNDLVFFFLIIAGKAKP